MSLQCLIGVILLLDVGYQPPYLRLQAVSILLSGNNFVAIFLSSRKNRSHFAYNLPKTRVNCVDGLVQLSMSGLGLLI